MARSFFSDCGGPQVGPGASVGRWSGLGPAQVSPCEVGSRPVPGGGAAGYCVPFGWWGLFRCLGAQRPVARPAPGGGPAFFGRKPEERTPGRKRFFLPGPTFSGLGGPCGGPPSFLPGLRPICPTPVTARPPAGRAGRVVSRTGRVLPTPQSLPLGGKVPQCAHWGG